VFDTSEGRRPLEFQTGAGQLIKGFEDAVIGMSLNEKNPVTVQQPIFR
jgi:peptidylprolyl isomerase